MKMENVDFICHICGTQLLNGDFICKHCLDDMEKWEQFNDYINNLSNDYE